MPVRGLKKLRAARIINRVWTLKRPEGRAPGMELWTAKDIEMRAGEH